MYVCVSERARDTHTETDSKRERVCVWERGNCRDRQKEKVPEALSGTLTPHTNVRVCMFVSVRERDTHTETERQSVGVIVRET